MTRPTAFDPSLRTALLAARRDGQRVAVHWKPAADQSADHVATGHVLAVDEDSVTLDDRPFEPLHLAAVTSLVTDIGWADL